jgi:HAD superfamily hydrolase (TIGR01509 family)
MQNLLLDGLGQWLLVFYLRSTPPPISQEEASQLLIKRYQTEIQKKLHLVPGGAQAVQALAPYYSLALVSGSFRREIMWALNYMGIQDCFQVILGAEDYAKSKPAPDGYQKALQRLGRTPQEVLVFEDSTPGIVSAKAVGLWVVAITGTNHFNQDHFLADEKIEDLLGVDQKWVECFLERQKKPNV